MKNETQHVFIIGSKGIPGKYGGYETFVDKLTEYHQNEKSIKYHVACKSNNSEEFKYHNARCFNVKVPNIGPAQAIYYDVAALSKVCKYIKKNNIKNPIVYILACRIGPFTKHFRKKIHRLGGKLYVNPDGHEWMRAKWSAPVRKYWKISEQMMVKQADLLICDSKNIEKYIKETYSKYNPKTTFIAYGAETRKSKLSDNAKELLNWYKEHDLKKKEYYLVVGRFVPENNYETMIKEFMKSNTKKDFAIITNVNDKFLNELEDRLHFKKDKRIKFVGTVYDKELLMKIRENAYGYFHGHEVGGTNPSLLEALGSTDLNLLLDVGFNREVAEDSALYWTKDNNDLSKLIDSSIELQQGDINQISKKAKERIKKVYSWDFISNEYKNVFLERNNNMNTIRDLQMSEYEILKEAIRICKKYKINYFVIGGTFLGAIRHGGFIPWDDDIDIAMFRDDYEMFLNKCTTELKKKFKVLNYRTDKNFHYCITRLVDTTKEVIEKRDKNKKSYVSIDIFPLDGAPSNSIKRKLYYFNIMKHRAILSLCYKENIDKERKRGFAEKVSISILTKIPFAKLFSSEKEKKLIDEKLKKQLVEKSEYVGCLMGAYRTREMVPKEYYGNGAYYDFEDIKVRGPEKYDEYLTHIYGNYMEIPKDIDRKTHYEIVNIKGE